VSKAPRYVSTGAAAGRDSPLLRNAPGERMLHYRVGDYQRFSTELLARLPLQAVDDPAAPTGKAYPLAQLRVDAEGDWITGLIKSWAMAGDILTFYQERIANEGYLATAVQPFSINALMAGLGIRPGTQPARPVPTAAGKAATSDGYQIDPGVAATADIAFTVLAARGIPTSVAVPAGAAIRNHPADSSKPQTFETDAALIARLAWNSMSLRGPPAATPPTIGRETLGLRLAGTRSGLKPGDRLLVTGVSQADGATGWCWRTIETVEPNRSLGWTLVTWSTRGPSHGLPMAEPQVFGFGRTAPLFGHDAVPFAKQPLRVILAHPHLLSGGVQHLDNTATPVPCNVQLPTDAVRAAVIDGNDALYLATASGVYWWSDRDGWQAMTQGLTNRDVHCLAVDGQGYVYAGTGGGGTFRAAGTGASWSSLAGSFFVPKSQQPVKSSLPISVVRQFGLGAAPDTRFPAQPMAVVLTDEGVFASNLDGAGWKCVWPIPLYSYSPVRIAEIAALTYWPTPNTTAVLAAVGSVLSIDGANPPGALSAARSRAAAAATSGPEELAERFARALAERLSATAGMGAELAGRVEEVARHEFARIASEIAPSLAEPGGPAPAEPPGVPYDERTFDSPIVHLAFRDLSYGPTQPLNQAIVILRSPGSSCDMVQRTLNTLPFKFYPDDQFAPFNWGLPPTGSVRVLVAAPENCFSEAANPNLQNPAFLAIWNDGKTDSLWALPTWIWDWFGSPWQKVGPDFPVPNVAGVPLGYQLAAGGNGSVIISSPLRVPDDWPDFQAGDDAVDLAAKGFTVIPGSWLVLDGSSIAAPSTPLWNAYRVVECTSGTRQDYALDESVLHVTLEPPGLASGVLASQFDLRAVTAYAQSSALPIAPLQPSLPQVASGDRLVIEGLVENLPPCQLLAVTGKRLRARVAHLGGVYRSATAPGAPGAVTRLAGLGNEDITCLAADSFGDVVVAGTHAAGAFLSIDGGTFWQAIVDPPSSAGWTFIALAYFEATVVAATTAGMFVLDGWTRWVPTNFPAVPTALAVQAAAPNATQQQLYACGSDGRVYLALPTQTQMPWQALAAPALSFPPISLAVQVDGTVFVGTAGHGVFVWQPNAETWSDENQGLANLSVRALLALPDGTTLAGTDGAGLYSWQQAARTWVPSPGTQPGLRIRCINGDGAGGLIVGSHGGGAFRRAADTTAWTPLPTGLSNDVGAIANTSRAVLIGCRSSAVLQGSEPTASAELAVASLARIPDPETRFARELGQGLVTAALRRALANAKQTVSERAAVVAATTAGWVLAEGEDILLLSARAGEIRAFSGSDRLVVAAAPDASGACRLLLPTGFIGAATIAVDDLVWRPADAQDPAVAEVATVLKATAAGDLASTDVELAAPLRNAFDAATVRVCGNVAAATQGATVSEVLGNGNAQVAFQQFRLAQPPLTFVPAPPPLFRRSTLTVFVDKVAWTPVASLSTCGPNDHVYTVDIESDGGALITFGDGVHGARLPTGTQNVTATYRTGMGPAGDVPAASLAIMLKQPAGIAKVTNPIPATAGQEPEPIPTIRARAPRRLRAGGRLITRNDYADFVASYPGVDKAAAWELDVNGRELLQLTITGHKPLGSEDPLVYLLRAELAARAAVPAPPVDLAPAELITFSLAARLWLAAGADAVAVAAQARSALLSAYSAAARALAQPVYAAEVNDTLQAVSGVAGVALDALYRTDQHARVAQVLAAESGRWNGVTGAIQPAQLLAIDANAMSLATVAPRS
jgi:predicted phage baseplate assembly protein